MDTAIRLQIQEKVVNIYPCINTPGEEYKPVLLHQTIDPW